MTEIEDLKDKISNLISEQIVIYLQYCDVFQKKIFPNKDTVSLWIKQIQPQYTDFDNKLLNVEKNIALIPDIIEQYHKYIETFQSSNDISVTYLKLLFNTLNGTGQIRQLPNWIAPLNDSFDKVKGDDLNYNAKQTTVSFLVTILNSTLSFAEQESLKIAQIQAFDYFKYTDKNYVIIGANGSGKSSFARNTKQILGENIAIIAAQKIFSFRKINSVTLGKSSRENVWNFQHDPKLYKNDDFASQIEHDLQNVFQSLVEEQNDSANKYFEADKTEHKAIRSITTLERVITLWHEILLHRQLKYEEGDLKVVTPAGKEYSFMQLSDGEKAVFYYIAHVLLAQKDSYIIVDEPENHLHLALVTKLWDMLEQERKDCRFIYLTHNLDFAASRNNAKKIWMKKFMEPAHWDMQSLPEDKDLPEILYMELLGSRKPVLFCEGTKASLDYKLYNRIFPNYTIIPVRGHIQVISYTRAFNKSASIHGNRAIGLIDGDYHTQDEKEAWLKDNIFCLDVQEIENLLCDELLLKMTQQRCGAPESSIQTAKDTFFKELSQNIETQALDYATQRINEYFKSHLLEDQKTEKLLKEKLEELKSLKDINIDTLISERKIELQRIIDKRDYEDGIKKCNNKGLIGTVPVCIYKEYKERIFTLLDQEPDVLEAFRKKHFSHVPQEL
ncbi:MAG: AAA family ATPase [Treponema sp.]|nr:AAA family ATPase [Treponema sp.]